jgi:hypothetical protein
MRSWDYLYGRMLLQNELVCTFVWPNYEMKQAEKKEENFIFQPSRKLLRGS